MNRTARRLRWITLAVLALAGFLLLSKLALVAMRNHAYGMSLHYHDALELVGRNSRDSSRRTLDTLMILPAQLPTAGYSDLVLCVGDNQLRLASATVPDVLALGAEPGAADPEKFSLLLPALEGNSELGLGFDFRDGALAEVFVIAGEATPATGLPPVSVLRSDGSQRLDLPCSVDEATAFFGRPTKRTYHYR